MKKEFIKQLEKFNCPSDLLKSIELMPEDCCCDYFAYYGDNILNVLSRRKDYYIVTLPNYNKEKYFFPGFWLIHFFKTSTGWECENKFIECRTLMHDNVKRESFKLFRTVFENEFILWIKYRTETDNEFFQYPVL